MKVGPMRKKRRPNFFFVFRLLLALSIFLLVALFIFKIFVGGKWDGKRRFNVVVDADPLLVFSIEPVTHQATVLVMPVNTVLEVPYGYSSYPAGAVYELGKLDVKKGGGKLLEKSIENTFGIYAEGFFARKDKNKFTMFSKKEQLLDFKRTYFSLGSLMSSAFQIPKMLNTVVTDLSPADIFRLFNAVRDIRSDQITFVNLGKSIIAREEKLPDQTTVTKIDPDLFDRMFSSSFQDQAVRLQNVSVEVVNAADRENVAAQFSRVLENLGASVVSKSNSSHPQKESCVINLKSDSLKSSVLVERLKKFYNCQLREGVEAGVSDIKISLGEEFIK